MRRPYYGWVIVGACFLGSFVVFGVSYSFSVFLDRILDAFGRSRGATSLAFGVQTLSIYVGASGVGVLVDRYGTRRMLVVGTLLTTAGLASASRATDLPSLILTYGVVTGLGLSVVYVVSYATVTRWFDRRLGLAGGLASAGLGVGMLVVVPSATWLVARLGWRDALGALAVGAAAVLLVAAALVRDDPTTTAVEPPDGEFVGATPTANSQTLADQYADAKDIATRPSFGLLLVGWTLVYATLYVVLAHLVLHTVDGGLSRAVGATALALVGATSAVGRVGIGHLGDVSGRLRVFVACSAAMGVSTLWLVAADTAAGIYAFAVVYGLAYGGNGALLSPLVADLFGRANINAVFGLLSMAFAISGLIAPSAAGATYDALGTYDPAFLATGAAALVGAGAVAAAGRLA
ncbi:MFS transporter [Halorussus amylolyticus]|uniref:MFS transporter n=1 Tax=Halorussus amylolyticus TaxID=1126242 RepID=UPI00104D9E3A|nr:MFS transporter [Halorussus amylolyticus]